MENAINIYYCGDEKCQAGHFFGPAIRPHYLIHFVISGEGIFRAKGRTFSLKAGEGFLIHPQEVTYYEADKINPWHYCWLAFDGKDGEALLQEYGLLKDNLIFRMEKNQSWQNHLSTILDLFNDINKVSWEVKGHFYLLMSAIEKPKISKDINIELDYFKIAQIYIRHNYGYNIKVQDIANYVGIERTYLYKIFLKNQKLSPKAYLTYYRILAAKDMLLNSEYSITQIAISCGFHDVSGFSRSFRQQIRKSPRIFRQEKRKINP